MSWQSKWTKPIVKMCSNDSVSQHTRSKTRGVRGLGKKIDHTWDHCPYWGRDHSKRTRPGGRDKRKGSVEPECDHCGDGSRDEEWENCDNCPEGSGTYMAGSHPGCRYAPYLGKHGCCSENDDGDESGPYIAGSHPGCRYAPYHGKLEGCGTESDDGDEGAPYIAGSHPGCRYAPYKPKRK